MKLKNILLPIVAGGSLVFLSCGEKKDPADSPADGGNDENTSETATKTTTGDSSDSADDTPAPPVPEVAVDKLAASAGFAALAPKNTEGYLSIRGAYDMYERLQKTELGKLILSTMAEQGMDLSEAEQTEEFQMVKAVIGEELFAVFGDGSGDQLMNVNDLGKSSNYHQMKMMVGLISSELKWRRWRSWSGNSHDGDVCRNASRSQGWH